MHLHHLKRAAGALLCGGALALAGCDSDTAPADTTTITGTAAIGAPVAGATVSLRCKGGVTASDSTETDGTWTVAVPTTSLPCAVQINTGSVELYSFTIGSGGTLVTNLSPLTSLALAGAAGAAPGDAWFDSLNDSGLTTLSGDLAAAIDELSSALEAGGYVLPSVTFNPFSAAFTAVAGDDWDDLLEALGAALAADDSDLATLLASYAAGGSLPSADDGGSGGTGGIGGSITTGYASSPSFSPASNGFTITSSGGNTTYQFSNTKPSGSSLLSHVLSVKVDGAGNLVDVNYTDARDLGFTTSIVCGSAYGVSCAGLVVTPGTLSVTVTFTEVVMKVRSGVSLGADTTFNGTLTGVIPPA